MTDAGEVLRARDHAMTARWPMSVRNCMPSRMSPTAAYAARCARRTESPSAVTHAPAAHHHAAVLQRRARVEHVHVRVRAAPSRGRGRRSARPCAARRDSRRRRARRRARRAPVPLRLDRVERAVDGVLHEVDEVGLEARHDRLRLGVAHAAVELEDLRRVRRRRSSRRHRESPCRAVRRRPCRDGRRDDLAHDARACSAGVTTGAGEYAPMPPVFGPCRRRADACGPATTRAAARGGRRPSR